MYRPTSRPCLTLLLLLLPLGGLPLLPPLPPLGQLLLHRLPKQLGLALVGEVESDLGVVSLEGVEVWPRHLVPDRKGC